MFDQKLEGFVGHTWRKVCDGLLILPAMIIDSDLDG
jgi:hypothetical protein